MNKILNSKYLPWLVAGLGGVGMALQGLLILLCTDEKGLISSGHILHILAWVVAVAAVALTVMAVLGLNGTNRYNLNYPASIPGAVGSFAAAVGIAVSLLFFREDTLDILALLWLIFGIFAALSLVFTGLCRMQGIRPGFFFHAIVCLFFALHLVCRCRTWSSEPQLERYSFALLASVGMMLTAYHRSAFDCGIGRRRMQLGVSMLTCFFCLTAAPGSDNPVLYLACAVWAITNLCVLTPPKRRPRPIEGR